MQSSCKDRSARLQCLARRLLQSMRHICSDGAAGVSHQHQVSGVHHQIAVAEHGPTLADQDVGIAYATGTCTWGMSLLPADIVLPRAVQAAVVSRTFLSSLGDVGTDQQQSQ